MGLLDYLDIKKYFTRRDKENPQIDEEKTLRGLRSDRITRLKECLDEERMKSAFALGYINQHNGLN